MGLIDSATTVTIRARLTTLGREKLLTNTNSIFSNFILGDSDANYNTSEELITGRIPTNSGDLGANGGTNDNIYDNVGIGSKLFVTVAPTVKKKVERNSSVINTTIVEVGEETVSGDSLTFLQIDKNTTNSQNTNYFKSLSLPITTSSINTFTGTTSQNGGWSDTPFSGLGVTKVLMGVVDNSKYGEIIDGKSVKLSLPVYTGFTSGGTGTGITTYNLYSTYPNTTISRSSLDSDYVDRSTYPQTLFKRRNLCRRINT